jgi:hypothetical protein
MGLSLVRQSGVPATQTLWAEDGVIFYTQAVGYSFWHTVLSAYNGYDQLVPRLAVQLTALFPVRDAPTVVALAGAAGLATSCCLVFHMARGHVASAPLRALLALSMVLLPLALVEMLDNLVNLPWWLYFTAFWALLWRPSSAGGRVVAAAACALAVASEPLVILLLPLALVRAVAARTWRDNAASLGLMVGLGYQAAVVLAAHGQSSFARRGLSAVPAAFGARVGIGWLTGLRATDAMVRWSRTGTEALGWALFAALVVWGLTRGARRARAFTAAVAVLAPLCFAVPVWLRGAGPYMQTAKSVGYAGRYAATPMLMLISAVVVIAGSGQRRRRRSTDLVVVALCAALLLPAWVADLRDSNGRSRGPTWASQLSVAAAQCRAAPGLRLVRVEVDPVVDFAVLPCGRVELSGRPARPGR